MGGRCMPRARGMIRKSIQRACAWVCVWVCGQAGGESVCRSKKHKQAQPRHPPTTEALPETCLVTHHPVSHAPRAPLVTYCHTECPNRAEQSIAPPRPIQHAVGSIETCRAKVRPSQRSSRHDRNIHHPSSESRIADFHFAHHTPPTTTHNFLATSSSNDDAANE